MNALHYLLQVNVYLVLFYGFYWLVLRGETFHQLNRWYLVAAAALSFFIPVWESDWVQRWFVTEQVHETLYTYYNPETVFVTTLRPEAPGFRLTWGDAFAFGYLTGVLVALGKFGYQMAHLERFLRRRKRSTSRQAFSFFGHLFVGKSLDKRDTILAHERVHVRQLHSADVLLFELILIFNWFNPVVYLYRRSIRHLHEFIADEVASRCEASPADYALLLFSQQFGVETHQLVNPFFSTSLLKRRILMLQKPRSRRTALFKYGFIAPLFGGMLVMSSASVAENPVLQRIETQVGSAQAIVEKPVQDDEAIVTGTVTDEAGQPLAGVWVVQHPNETSRNETDASGRFRFLRREQAKTVRFSLPGYAPSELRLGTQRQLNVRLVRKASISEQEGKAFMSLAVQRAIEARRGPLMGQSQVNYAASIGFAIDQEGWIQDIVQLNEADGDPYGIFAAVRNELRHMPRWETGRGIAYRQEWKFFSTDAGQGTRPMFASNPTASPDRKMLGYSVTSFSLDPLPQSGGPSPYGVTARRALGVTPDYEYAQFPGGDQALQEFLKRHLRYPAEAAPIRKTEMVFARFVIDEEGNLSQFTLPEKYGYGFDEEALRIFKLLPPFEPYKKEGKPVVSRYQLKLRFDPNEMLSPAPVVVPAAPDTLPKDPDRVFTVAEKNAGFPGGNKALSEYLAKNLRYPAAARRAKVEGRVFLAFVVEKDGSISDVNVLKGRGFGLDEEAIRVLKAMPKWVPAKAEGKIVRSQFNLPIEFRLDRKSKKGQSKEKVLENRDDQSAISDAKNMNPIFVIDNKKVSKKEFRRVFNLGRDGHALVVSRDPNEIKRWGDTAKYGGVISLKLK